MKISDFKSHALGTLAAWIDGWTDPDGDGHQYRLRIMGSNPDRGTIDVRVQAGRPDGPPEHDMYYRITMTVEEV